MFTEGALESIYRATDGVPRLVNQVCDHALLLAHTAGVHQLTDRQIEQAWADLQQLPTPWSASAETNRAGGVVEFGQLDEEDDTADSAEIGVAADLAGDQLEYLSAKPEHLGLRLAGGLDDAESSLEDALAEEIAADELEADEIVASTDQLRSIEVGVVPRCATSVEVAHSANPFAEAFGEEEVIVDRYSTEHASVWAQMPRVYSSEGRILDELLQPYVQTAKIVPVADAAMWNDTESDLIVVEDDPVAILPARTAPSRAYRQEYSQLFAKLRRG